MAEMTAASEQVAALKELHELRFQKDDEARDRQHKEYERRLTELNHEKESLKEMQQGYLTRSEFQQFEREYREKHEGLGRETEAKAARLAENLDLAKRELTKDMASLVVQDVIRNRLDKVERWQESQIARQDEHVAQEATRDRSQNTKLGIAGLAIAVISAILSVTVSWVVKPK